jgi:hypothetical protein
MPTVFTPGMDESPDTTRAFNSPARLASYPFKEMKASDFSSMPLTMCMILIRLAIKKQALQSTAHAKAISNATRNVTVRWRRNAAKMGRMFMPRAS